MEAVGCAICKSRGVVRAALRFGSLDAVRLPATRFHGRNHHHTQLQDDVHPSFAHMRHSYWLWLQYLDARKRRRCCRESANKVRRKDAGPSW
jgi:hypothetical protein